MNVTSSMAMLPISLAPTVASQTSLCDAWARLGVTMLAEACTHLDMVDM